MSKLAQLRARAEGAQRAFEEGRARLFRADGSQVFSDAEQVER